MSLFTNNYFKITGGGAPQEGVFVFFDDGNPKDTIEAHDRAVLEFREREQEWRGHRRAGRALNDDGTYGNRPRLAICHEAVFLPRDTSVRCQVIGIYPRHAPTPASAVAA